MARASEISERTSDSLVARESAVAIFSAGASTSLRCSATISFSDFAYGLDLVEAYTPGPKSPSTGRTAAVSPLDLTK